MEILELEPDRGVVRGLCFRLKSLLESDHLLSEEEAEEAKTIREQIKTMGLILTWEMRVLDLTTRPRVIADITVWAPKKLTLQ